MLDGAVFASRLHGLENQQQSPPQGKDVHRPRFILIAEVQGACGIHIVEAKRLPIFDPLRCFCLGIGLGMEKLWAEISNHRRPYIEGLGLWLMVLNKSKNLHQK